MHTESDYAGCAPYLYPERGMADRLLCVHIQSPVGLWAWMTLSYNSLLYAYHNCHNQAPIIYIYIYQRTHAWW